MDVEKMKGEIISAGEQAVKELIKVAKESIIKKAGDKETLSEKEEALAAQIKLKDLKNMSKEELDSLATRVGTKLHNEPAYSSVMDYAISTLNELTVFGK